VIKLERAAGEIAAGSGSVDGLLELGRGRNDADEAGSVQLLCRLEHLSPGWRAPHSSLQDQFQELGHPRLNINGKRVGTVSPGNGTEPDYSNLFRTANHSGYVGEDARSKATHAMNAHVHGRLRIVIGCLRRIVNGEP
jgi:hypothetical protein